MEVTVYISREKDGSYSAYVADDAPINYGLIGEGATPQAAIDEWNSMYEAMKESYRKDNMPFVEATFRFAYDIPSFLQLYAGTFTYAGLASLTGVSAAQLSQYASGYRNPSARTAEKIQRGLRAFANELSQVRFV